MKINKADEYFSQALKEIIETGIDTSQYSTSNVRTRWSDGNLAHYTYVTNKVFEYDLTNGEFPIISLRPQAWKSAIKDDKLTWVQVSDLQYWNSAAAKLYYVRYIPQNIFIDQEGKIVKRKVEKDKMEEFLTEFLGLKK